MNTEYECRLLEVNVKEFCDKLNKCGAKFVGDWLQMRYCYDFNPVQENSWIRLRTNGKETTLTIKEIKDKTISGTKELEVIVSNFEDTDAILNKLGYVARSKQENRRIRYILNNVEIDVDIWPLIPAYVEFEGKNEEDIKSVCELLGLNYEELTTLDVDNIFKSYGIDLANHPILVLEEEKKN